MKKSYKVAAVYLSAKVMEFRVLDAEGKSDEEIINSKFISIDNDFLGNLRCINTGNKSIDIYDEETRTWVPVCSYKRVKVFDMVVD